MILILISQLLLTQHWLCSTDFDELLPCWLFRDYFSQQIFWLGISGCFRTAYYWSFFSSSFWKACFCCWSCLDWSFLLPRQDSPFAQRCQQLLIPCFWHHGQFPWEHLSAAHTMTWFFCRNHIGEGMKSEGALSFILHTQIQMYVKKQLGKSAKSGNPEIIFVFVFKA